MNSWDETMWNTIFAILIGILLLIPIIAAGKNISKTQVIGYIVNVEQASFPWTYTQVTFTIEHPTSIVDAQYFRRTYYGHHEFDLHQRYRITAHRSWFEWYPQIVKIEVIE